MRRVTEAPDPDASRPATGSPRRGRRRWLLVLTAGVDALVTVVVLLIWWIAGDTGWTQVINATTFWWLLPSVPLTLLALVLRRPRAAAAFALPLIVLVWSYGPLFLPKDPHPGPPDLRVATYNTQLVDAPDISHVAAMVRHHAPDVVLLQEIFPGPKGLLDARLQEELPNTWFGPIRGVGGVAVLSRYDIVDVRPIEPPSISSRPTAVVTLDVEGVRVQVVSVHLTSPCPRCDPSFIGRQAHEARTRHDEMETVIAALDPALPAIVGGDFNSERRSDPYRLLARAGFRDAQWEAGTGPGFTWSSGTSIIRIDWVMARGLAPLAAWVDEPRASDHRAVVVDLAWPS